MGYSESTPCFLQLECKGTHFAKVASRAQFFFGADAQVRAAASTLAHHTRALFRAQLLEPSCSRISHAFQLQYSVLCVDQVLGVDLVSFTIEGTA
jgi:hypothetical protein